jgi:hypothetical protein
MGKISKRKQEGPHGAPHHPGDHNGAKCAFFAICALLLHKILKIVAKARLKACWLFDKLVKEKTEK